MKHPGVQHFSSEANYVVHFVPRGQRAAQAATATSRNGTCQTLRACAWLLLVCFDFSFAFVFFPLLSFLCVLSFALFSLLSLCAYFVTVVNVKFPFLKVKISNGRRVRKSTEKILARMVSIFGLHATLTTGASCITLWARTSTTTLHEVRYEEQHPSAGFLENFRWQRLVAARYQIQRS